MEIKDMLLKVRICIHGNYAGFGCCTQKRRQVRKSRLDVRSICAATHIVGLWKGLSRLQTFIRDPIEFLQMVVSGESCEINWRFILHHDQGTHTDTEMAGAVKPFAV